MGVPLYGRTFTLASPNNNGIGANAVGAGGSAGPYTRLIGTLGYNEVSFQNETNSHKIIVVCNLLSFTSKPFSLKDSFPQNTYRLLTVFHLAHLGVLTINHYKQAFLKKEKTYQS